MGSRKSLLNVVKSFNSVKFVVQRKHFSNFTFLSDKCVHFSLWNIDRTLSQQKKKDFFSFFVKIFALTAIRALSFDFGTGETPVSFGYFW